jgi:diaminopimelate epimerase
VSATEDGFFLVPLKGIVHLVVPVDKSEQFLSDARATESTDSFKKELKLIAEKLMKKYSLTRHPACGVMFLEEMSDGLLMHPCVLVTGAESSMYYETACGSGSMAVAMAHAFLNKDSVKISVTQPSRHNIDAIAEVADKRIINAYIDGKVDTDGRIIGN